MDKVEIVCFGIIAIAVIALAYILLTTYIFPSSSANNGGGSGFGIAVKTGSGGCVSSSGNCPQPGSTGPGQVLINGSGK